MELIHSIKVNGRACCAIREEVWVAKQSGGVAVFAARTGEPLADVSVTESDGGTAAQVTQLTAVFDKVWVATNSGEVHVYDAERRCCVDSLRMPGAERKVPVVQLCFNGHVAVVATGSGSLFLHHPLTLQRLTTLSTASAPCTAAMQFYSFVVGGDAKGGLHVWDVVTGECVVYHAESRSEVVSLLHEPTTGTIWVARGNEHVDVYALEKSSLVLLRRVSGVGKVTSMVAVSGSVVATTFTKRVVLIDAATAQVLPAPAALRKAAVGHTSFIHGCCKAMHQETAQVWTVGKDGAAHVWRVTGKSVAVRPVPLLPPSAQAALCAATPSAPLLNDGEPRVGAAAEHQRRADMSDDLRRSREEAQELRLRLATKQERWHTAAAELAAEKKLRGEMEERIAKLTKDVTDITSKVSVVERERNTLQSELTQLKTDVSKANTNASARQAEKSAADQQLSQERVNASTLGQRLRDTEAKLAALQAEHRRVCDAAGAVVPPSSLTKESQDNLLKNSAVLVTELEQARRMNQLMSAALASMEYTIRRREEEDKDVTALLNAYRRRVADRVSDPHLSALLLATIVRNAPRFDLECDAFTKAQLMDRNGPFLQFVQSLRLTDPEAYAKLIHYLQSPAISDTVNAETQVLLDRFVALAAKEGEVSGEDLASFKRSIPGLMSGADAVQAAMAPAHLPTVVAAASNNASGAALSGAAGTAGASGGAANASSLAALLQGTLPALGKPAADALSAADKAKTTATTPEQDFLSSAVIRELRGTSSDENFVREQQAMFEFILKTRRLLAECLALLQKRTTSARQVVEALCVNAGNAGQVVAATPTSAASSPRKSLQPVYAIFNGIIKELDSLVSEIVNQYLTAAEKERHGVLPVSS